MGCAGQKSAMIKEDNRELKIYNKEENKIEYYDEDTLCKILSNYILFYKDLNKNYKGKIYLVKTEFFIKILGIFGISLKNEEFNVDQLKKKISSINIQKFEVILITSERDLIDYERSNIEIVNVEILKNFGINEKVYINKESNYKFISNEELEIIFNDKSKVLMKKINEHFQIIYPEKCKFFENSKKEDIIFNSKILLKSTVLPFDDNDINKHKKSSINSRNDNNENTKNNEEINLNNNKSPIEDKQAKEKENNDEKENQSLSNEVKENNNKIKNESKEQILCSLENINDNPTVACDIKLNNLSDENDKTKIKNEYELYFNYYKQLFKELDKIDQLINLDIDSEKKYSDYAIVNKRYFNKLIKLFESEENFSNEEYIIDSLDNLTKIDNINININTFENRIQSIINNYSLFQVETEQITNTEIKYPKEFTLIKKDLLVNFRINQEMLKNNKFEILFGENYLFIKEGNNIIIYSKQKLFFNAIIIFECFKESYFDEDLVPNIKNKGGFDYFFDKIGFDFSKIFKYQHMKDEKLLSNIIIIKKEDKIQKEYLKQIIFSLSNIVSLKEELVVGFKDEKEVNIITLFLNFIKNNKTDKDIINEIFKKIKNNGIDIYLNNFKITIELVLDKMHQQLNSNEIFKYITSIEDNDKDYVYNTFKIKFDSQNNTIIRKIFFGIIMKTIIPGCSCKEKSYSCESSKYLYLNCEIIKENDKLEDILENWVKPKKIKYKCKNCVIECEAEISKNFYEYPEILIIILNDSFCQKKKLIEFPIELVIPIFSYKYKLINVISNDQEENILNIIGVGEEKFIVNHNDKKEEINSNEIRQRVSFPRVLFYKKIEKNDINLEESFTEVGVKKYFEKSIATGPFNMNDRLKNSIDYIYQISGNEEQINELFKLEKKSCNEDNKSQLNNELVSDKNSLNNDSEKLNKQISNIDNNELIDQNSHNYIKKSSDFIKPEEIKREINMNDIKIGDNQVNKENNEINNQSIRTDMVILNNQNKNNFYKPLISNSIVYNDENSDNEKNMDCNPNNDKNIAINYNKDNNNNNARKNNLIKDNSEFPNFSNNLNNNGINNNYEFPNFSNNLNNNGINNNYNNININNNVYNSMDSIKINNNKNNDRYDINNQNINFNNNIFSNNSNFKIYKEKNNTDENLGYNHNKPFDKNIGNNNLIQVNNKNQNNNNINSEKQSTENNFQLNQNNNDNQNNLENINKYAINIHFSFRSGRIAFISLVNDNISFREVISKIIQNYEWAQEINFGKMIFLYKGSTIYDMNKTIREYVINNNAKIEVVPIEEDYKI